MPRVYTRTAGKDYPQQGIKKGDTYYAWAFYRQAERKSLTRPTRQQLTQRDELVAVYDAEDAYNALDWMVATPEDIDDVVAHLETAREAAQEKLDNLEQAFAGGNPQIDELNDFLSGLEQADQELADARQLIEEEERGEEQPDITWPDI